MTSPKPRNLEYKPYTGDGELVKPGTKKWEMGNEETEIGNGLVSH